MKVESNSIQTQIIMKRIIYPKMVLIALCLFTSTIAFSQENPFRIGVKIGFPNVIGGNIEYVTPLLENKLSVSVDYSGLKANSFLDEGDTGKFRYFEAGANYYFTKEGEGLYGGLSYGSFKIDGTLSDLDSNDETKSGGSGVYDTSSSSINLLLGAKLGRRFYFRPEIGFAFSGFPETVSMDVTFPDGSRELQYVLEKGDLPSVLSSGLMFKIGFGVAF